MAVPPQRIGDGYTGQVIVRLVEPLAAARGTTLEEVFNEPDQAKGVDRAAMIDLLTEFGRPPSRRLASVSLDRLLEMDETAAKSARPPLFKLASFWRVDFRKDPAAAPRFVTRMREQPEMVANAYLEGDVESAALVPDPVGNPLFDIAGQGHLRGGQLGINAPAAWQHAGGDGAGVGLMDLVADWHFSHVDLLVRAPTLGLSPVWGEHSGDLYEANHGMAVLGTIVAENNDKGGIGVAPGVTNVRTVSHIKNGERAQIFDAVINIVPLMARGDVLLIEVQTLNIPGFGYPVEVRDAEFAATQIAVANGIIVVAAAGNGTRDLDTYSVGGKQILNRAAGPAGGYRDSGAIMVGACRPAVPPARHSRLADSNRGSRIDCYAWGADVLTTWHDNYLFGIPNNCTSYGDFVRTSAAAAIIAGAALCVQGVRKASGAIVLTPGQMQVLLSDPATGIPSVTPAADKIGVMPDLGQVIPRATVMPEVYVPDVYVRDWVGDNGTIPSPLGLIGQSPDIIISGTQVTGAEAQAKWGEGSGYENRDDFGAHVTAGHDAWIHVRLKNRGASLASQARAQVFWADSGTLVLPGQWQPIGTTAPIDVPQGDTLVVSAGVRWPKENRPVGVEHFCLVAVVGSVLDPAPMLPSVGDLASFFAFMQISNNLAWRNINVVHFNSSPLARWAEVTPFYFVGAPEQDLVFDFEIVQRLPAGVRAHLRVPTDFTGLFKHGALEAHVDKKEERTVLTLPTLPRLPVRAVPMPAGQRFRAELLLEIGENVQLNGHSVTIRQRWHGVELGSITWRFKPPPPDRGPDDDDDE